LVQKTHNCLIIVVSPATLIESVPPLMIVISKFCIGSQPEIQFAYSSRPCAVDSMIVLQ